MKVRISEATYEEMVIPIREILYKLGVTNYTIDEQGFVSVGDDVDISDNYFTEIPVKFKEVSGDFFCGINNLTTLKNCPIYVGENFSCDMIRAKSLEYCPDEVMGDFSCEYNTIEELPSTKKIVHGNFSMKHQGKRGGKIFTEEEIRAVFEVGGKVVL